MADGRTSRYPRVIRDNTAYTNAGIQQKFLGQFASTRRIAAEVDQ